MNKQQFLDLGLTEDQATKAEAESKKELETYVPKTRFDEVNNSKKDLEKTVKDRDTQLEDLKKSSGDNETLKAQIEALQKENKTAKEKYDSDLKDIKVSNAIKLAIADKAQDAELVAGLFDKSKLILNEDGNVVGLEDQLKTLQEGKPFLFKAEQTTKGNQDPPAGFKIGNDNTQSNTQTATKPTSLFGAVAAHLGQQGNK
ncbi:phage scaffolding protein [Clostridium beijerinckii]|uniref:phage scaffolding protein n=1 Tax=Clostridium beijerinckii TaxID=1520 RepID=UPI00080A2F45|nr:phage scaffolding protein [Clostridium beijerinckii]OCA99393.1 hypothetical protein BGS1_09110 [Clostridium beijerinckii]